VNRFGWGLMALALFMPGPVSAQQLTVNELKAKIFEAKMVEKGFGGLKHCKELDGTKFYFGPRDRLLNLEDFNRSLQNLVKDRVFNPEKRRPWNEEDAKARWEQVKKQAIQDKANCELVAALPALQKELEQLEKKK
jgi:predicted NAD/FAD-dependent oxidoreductase